MPLATLRILLVVGDVVAAGRTRDDIAEVGGAVIAEVAFVSGPAYAACEPPAEGYHLIIVEVSSADPSSLNHVRTARAASPHAVIVVNVRDVDESLAISGLGAGADDYLVESSIDRDRLSRVLRFAERLRVVDEERRRLARDLALERAAREEAEAIAKRAFFLAEAGRLLGDATNVDALIARAGELAVPALGDVARFHWVGEEGVESSRSMVASGPAWNVSVDAKDGPSADGFESAFALLLKSGEPLVLPRMTREAAARFAPDVDLRARMRSCETLRVTMVPVKSEARIVGALTLLTADNDASFGSDGASVEGRAPKLTNALATDLSLARGLCAVLSRAIDQARRDQTKNALLSSVSHDLRNQLNIVSFIVAGLRRPPVAEQQCRSYADKLSRSADRMNRIIQELLDVSRLDAGTLNVEPLPHPPARLIAEATEPLRLLADEKRVGLFIDGVCTAPFVLADRARFLQVLSTLVGNAIKVTPTGGRVTLSASAEADEVRFAVRDTGPGISAEQLPRLFERHALVAGRNRDAAGFGLAIAKGLISAHGGRIWAESAVDGGATFHVTLPAAPEGDGEGRSAPAADEGE